MDARIGIWPQLSDHTFCGFDVNSSITFFYVNSSTVATESQQLFPEGVLFSLLPAMCLEYDQQNWLHVLCLSRRGYRTPKWEFFAGERVTLFSQTSKVRKIGAHSQSARINPYPRNEKPKHAHKGNLLSFLPLCPACCAFSNQPKISRISEGLAESMRWGK